MMTSFIPESLKRQNELVRALQKKLAEKERELANERWVYQQFLQSPSWRMTAPLRWFARQTRNLKRFLLRLAGRPEEAGTPVLETPAGENISPADVRFSADLKKLFTSLQRSIFENFLMSAAPLILPNAAQPEVSIILVLFNRAELTLA